MNIRAVDRDGQGADTSAAVSATCALLWAACRPDPDREAAEAARAAGADLEWASRVAVSQRLSSLVWRLARHWANEDDGWAAPLRQDALRCKAQALMVRPRLRTELLEPLAAADVDAMVIKGSAVAERYPEPGLRPMDDVDLLVPLGQHRRAAEVLRRAGWRATRRQGPPYSLSLAHPAVPGLPVDLHHDLAVPEEQIFRFTAADLWAGRHTVSLFGAPALVPVPELELVLLATHAGKPFHNFDRLLWAVDAAVIVGAAESSGEPIDWDLVGEAARRASARSALAVLLTQAARLGATSPQHLRALGAGAIRRRVLERPSSQTWPLERLDDQAVRDRLTYAVIDDPRLRVRRLLHEITEGGLLRAPGRGATVTFRILRRIWRLRRPDR